MKFYKTAHDRYRNISHWKISNLFRFENSFDIRNLHSLCEQKCPPHRFPNPQGYRNTTNWVKSIDNFKLGQILKIVTSSDRWSLPEHNGTIINAQLLMVMEKFKFFKKLLMGGHDEKLINFGKSKKNRWSLDNFKQKNFFWKKNFKIEIANVIFRTIFNESEFFLIDRPNRTRFSETRSLGDQNCMLKNF